VLRLHDVGVLPLVLNGLPPVHGSFAGYDAETRPVLCEWIDWIQPQLETLVGPVSFGIRP
jgi:hypothetical protein